MAKTASRLVRHHRKHINYSSLENQKYIPGQANCEDSTPSLPRLNTYDIAEPISKDCPTSPSASLDRSDIKVGIGPRPGGSPAGFLLLEDPTIDLSLALDFRTSMLHTLTQSRHSGQIS